MATPERKCSALESGHTVLPLKPKTVPFLSAYIWTTCVVTGPV